MKKILIWIMVAVFAISLSFVGAGCAQPAAETTAAETTAAPETTAEETMAEETMAEETMAEETGLPEKTFTGKDWADVKVGYVMPYLEGWFFYWDIGFKVPMEYNDIYSETVLTYWDPEAELQGVSVLNLNDLANALRPVVLPGEELQVRVTKEGKEYNQGVAYLDDGTMIVVDNTRHLIGKTIKVLITSVLQTSAGRMIFAKMDEGERPGRREDRRERR